VTPYDTLQLTATPRAATGDALPVSGTVVYTSTDLDHVQVGPTGLVRAVAPGTGFKVIATLAVGNFTRADTTVVNVTADSMPPMLASVSLHPVAPDSAKRAAFGFYLWPVYSADANGQPIPGLAMVCTSSDPTIVWVFPPCGIILANRPGHVRLTAATTAYGVTRADTIDFTVGLSLGATVALDHGNVALGTVTIATGGTVQWMNHTGQPADLTFDDPTNVAEDPACQCGAGNAPLFGNADPNDVAANHVSRRFPVPGTYTYHSSAVQGNGTIVVQDDR
jgi:plastocyanin